MVGEVYLGGGMCGQSRDQMGFGIVGELLAVAHRVQGIGVEQQQNSLLETEPVDIAASLARTSKKETFAFTQWFADWLRQPYTLPPIVTAYVKEWPGEETSQKALGARRVSQGGRLWLAKPKDEGVFAP